MTFEDTHGALDRRRTDPVIEMIAHKVSRMEQSMDKLTEAITKLAVVEEKQGAANAAIERAFSSIERSDERTASALEKLVGKIDRVETRLDVLEQAAPTTAMTNEWVIRVMWAGAALGATLLAGKLGFVLS